MNNESIKIYLKKLNYTQKEKLFKYMLILEQQEKPYNQESVFAFPQRDGQIF